MGVQEAERQLRKATQLEIKCASRLGKGQSLECHRSTAHHRSSTLDTVILGESDESGGAKCHMWLPPNSALFSWQDAFLHTGGWKSEYTAQAPHMM